MDMTFNPAFPAPRSLTGAFSRDQRDMERGRRAYASVTAAGGTALEAALAQVRATFAAVATQHNRGARVAIVIARGARHSETKARYGARARALMHLGVQTAADAVVIVRGWLRDAKATAPLAARLGNNHTRLSMQVLEELLLILRWIQRYHAKQFGRTLMEVAR
jgi:hypothetical protein